MHSNEHVLDTYGFYIVNTRDYVSFSHYYGVCNNIFKNT